MISKADDTDFCKLRSGSNLELDNTLRLSSERLLNTELIKVTQ
jgi:hypothetical protein